MYVSFYLLVSLLNTVSQLVLYEAGLYRNDADPHDVTRDVRIDGKLFLFRVTSENVRWIDVSARKLYQVTSGRN